MVHAVQKGEMEAPSKKVSDIAKSIEPSSATEFAETKHKGLPEEKKSAVKESGSLLTLTDRKKPPQVAMQGKGLPEKKSSSLARRLGKFLDKKSDMASSLMGGLKNVGNTAGTLWGRLSPKAQQAIIGAAIGGGVGGIGGTMLGGPEHRGRGALLGALLGAGAGGAGGYALGNRQMQQESFADKAGRGIKQMGREWALPNDSMFKRYRTPMQSLEGLYKSQSVHEASPAGLLVMLKFAERPSNSLIGLLAVTRSGESIKEANHLTKQASAEGTMEFINKAASITDAPSSRALADYVDCAVIMNPEISYLNKLSEALRSAPSINEAIKQAYPRVPTQMRVKIASKVIMDYLQARSIVGQLFNKQATYPGCGSGMKKKKSLKLKKAAEVKEGRISPLALAALIGGGGALTGGLINAGRRANMHRPAAATLEGMGAGVGGVGGAGIGSLAGAGIGTGLGLALGDSPEAATVGGLGGLLAGGGLGGLTGGYFGHKGGTGLARVLGLDRQRQQEDLAAQQLAQ